jgi:hypothetical protein
VNPAPPQPFDTASAIRWIGAGVVLLIAAIRCLAVMNDGGAFASDPLFDPLPRAGLTPAWSLALDVALIIGAAMVFMAAAMARWCVRWFLLALVAAPIAIVMVHGATNFDDAWRGATWIAGAIGGVAMTHAARDRVVRIAAIATLAAIVAPLVVRGLSQVLIEHPAMVEFYRRDPAAALAARGLEPGSSGAMIFERRLMQPEASGWFGLANVYGSFMALFAAAWLGALIVAVRARLEGGWIASAGLAAGFALTGLALSGGKGAIAAGSLGVCLVAAPLLSHRVRDMSQRRGAVIAIGLLTLALATVVVRGAILPESIPGDRGGSVLFRWHYLVASARMIGESPWLGVGSAGFQDAYLQHRVAESPEEVASAHSMFADWVATLGVLAGASLAVLASSLLVVATGSRGGEEVEHDSMVSSHDFTRSARGAVITAAITAAVAVLLEYATLDSASLLLRALGAAGWIAGVIVMARLASIPRHERELLWAFAAGAIAFVVHCQIEMTFTHSGAAAWAFIMLGTLAGDRERDAASVPGRRSLIGWMPAICLAILAIVVGALCVAPALRQERALRGAAAPLAAIGLDIIEHGRSPADRSREIDARRTSIARLEAAFDILPSNRAPLVAAYHQSLALAHLIDDRGEATAAAERAVHLARRVAELHASPGAHARLAAALRRLAHLTGDASHLREALAEHRAVTRLDPNGLRARLALADTLWDHGLRDDARAEYRLALDIDAAWRLDPLKQLTAAERKQVEDRLAGDGPPPDAG